MAAEDVGFLYRIGGLPAEDVGLPVGFGALPAKYPGRCGGFGGVRAEDPGFRSASEAIMSRPQAWFGWIRCRASGRSSTPGTR